MDESFCKVWRPLGEMEGRMWKAFEQGISLLGDDYIFLLFGHTQLKDRAW